MLERREEKEKEEVEKDEEEEEEMEKDEEEEEEGDEKEKEKKDEVEKAGGSVMGKQRGIKTGVENADTCSWKGIKLREEEKIVYSF